MSYQGVIIEESLQDASILRKLKILKTKVESIIPEHKTPWLKQWTLHTVLIKKNDADKIAEEISHSFDYSHGGVWYADFKSDKVHYVIYKDKVFKMTEASHKSIKLQQIMEFL